MLCTTYENEVRDVIVIITCISFIKSGRKSGLSDLVVQFEDTCLLLIYLNTVAYMMFSCRLATQPQRPIWILRRGGPCPYGKITALDLLDIRPLCSASHCIHETKIQSGMLDKEELYIHSNYQHY